MNRIPTLDSEVYTYQEGSTAVVMVVIRHKGGEEATIRYSMITTDVGVIKIDFEDKLGIPENVVVELIGFKDNKTLLPGSTARIIFRITLDYFKNKGKYQCVLVFDKTVAMTSLSF